MAAARTGSGANPAPTTRANPPLDDLCALLTEKFGTDWGVKDPIWLARFADASRQAATYRAGRVLLAGDAAHVIRDGGPGPQHGVQDAVNFGWKLAQVVAGTSADALLDTYQAQRHPVGTKVLQLTMAQGALITPDDRHDELRKTLAELLALGEARIHLAGIMSGLGIRYDVGDGHALALLAHARP